MTLIVKQLIVRGIVSSDPSKFNESAGFLSILLMSNKFIPKTDNRIVIRNTKSDSQKKIMHLPESTLNNILGYSDW